MQKRLIVIVGPTAIGKTALSIKLAKHFKTEVLSSDSRQFFKEMNIGTAVPSSKELAQANHHFIQHKSKRRISHTIKMDSINRKYQHEERFISEIDFLIIKNTWQEYIDFLIELQNSDKKVKLKNNIENF